MTSDSSTWDDEVMGYLAYLKELTYRDRRMLYFFTNVS